MTSSQHGRFTMSLQILAWAVICLLSIACGTEVEAQTADHHHHAAAFDVSHVTAVTDGHGASMGSVSFDTTCASDEQLRMGLALLHHMTYVEAGRTFESVMAEEPSCAIARWGVAMSWVHPLWPDVPTAEQLDRGWALLEEARALGTASARESAYIDALSAYYADAASRDEPARLRSYQAGWEAVAAAYPHDPEAAVFSALTTIATAAGSPDAAHRRIGAGIAAQRVLQAIPDHPGAHHYAIHAFDTPSAAERALDVADSYGRVAPANSHALHMTSHIFTRRGLWKESIEFNQRAADAAWNEPIGGQTSHHHLHAIDYLAYAYLQRGADAEADEVLAHLRALDGPAVNNAVSAYAFAAVPARIALERHDWAAAASVAFREPSTMSWDAYPHLEAIPVFARALGAARTGDLDSAREGAARLAALAEAATALPDAYDWATQVRIQEIGARAWIEFAEGHEAEAIAHMMESADLEATTDKNPVTPGEVLPAGELLGDMLYDAGRYEEAYQSYVFAMERTPNRFNSLYGAARSAEAAGMAEQARWYYGQLIEVAGESVTRGVELERARAYVSRR